MCFSLCIHHVITFAQLPTGELIIGLTGGINGETHAPGIFKGSNISGLPETVISTVFEDSTYRTQEIKRTGFTGGLFGNWRLDGADLLVLQLDALFSQHTGGYKYHDNEGLSYQMEFKYRYLYLMPSVKVVFNPKSKNWFFGRAGIYFGIPLAPENIAYSHDQEDLYGPYEYIQAELQTVLKGKGDAGFSLGIGYEHVFGERWSIIGEVSWHQGWKDVLEAKPNPYRFLNNANFIRWGRASLGVAFSLAK